MTTTDHLEIERKYHVDTTATVPFGGHDPAAGVGEVGHLQLEAVYYDTAELDLHRHGITLRRRTGGDDQGWHVKIPRGRDRKEEIHHPLGRTTSPPTALTDPVRAVIRDRPLTAVATISTDRTTYLLLADDEPVATLCDDRVTATATAHDQDDRVWREWELEVVEGADPSAVFARYEPLLLGSGARPAQYSSKIGHLLAGQNGRPLAGSAAGIAADTGAGTAVGARGQDGVQDAGDLLQQRLQEQVIALHANDAAVRAGSPQGIHQMRIAARRLRSALVTGKPLFSEPPDELRAELRWLGQALGPARDALVIRRRLEASLDGEPTDLVLGPVRRRLRSELVAEHKQGMASAAETLRSARYFRLLDALDSFVAELPLSPEAAGKARRAAGDLVRRDTRKLRRAIRAATRSGPDTRDQALHEARKKAKRLRYAAELAAPAGGRRAKKLAKRAKAVQRTLGDHQDSVVARERLRHLGAQSFLNGENGFTFGLLFGAERQRAASAEAAFHEAAGRLPTPRAAAAWVSHR